MTGGGPVRLLVDPRMDGRMAMAIDEALLESAGTTVPAATVRVYGFAPPTLSVGRFQPIRGICRIDAIAADGIVLVRRLTGGHAVLHDDELTYSAVFSRAFLRTRIGDDRKRAVYVYVAGFLLRGLAALGIEASVADAPEGNPMDPDCFASTGEFEIRGAGGQKLVGSAQASTRSAVLQHGSIPIGNPSDRVGRYIGRSASEGDSADRGPAATCIAELAGQKTSWDRVRSVFARAAEEYFTAVPMGLGAEESARAKELAESRYGRDEWTFAR